MIKILFFYASFIYKINIYLKVIINNYKKKSIDKKDIYRSFIFLI